MPIMKRSRRRSDVFRSRFREGPADFPLRQYMRCREDIQSSIVMLVVLAAFLISLVFFAHAVWRLFATHGRDLSPWYQRLALSGMVLMILLVMRRIWIKIRDIGEARRDLADLRRKLPPYDDASDP